MAQRRLADGFLARLAKAARVGGLLPTLALVAMLTMAGCGGGDDDSSDPRTTAARDSNAGDAPAQGAQSDGKESSDGKQGPGVPQPKGEPEPGATPQQRSKATQANIKLESPGFTAGSALPAAYTCDGKDESPPLQWSGLPSGAAELALLVLNSAPVKGKLFFDWAVAGLDPELSSLEAGTLPPGAVLGKNSWGKDDYSICPPAGGSENYVFMLYAVPKALSPEPGFDPLALREAILDQSGNVGFVIAPYSRS
jgi:phosphatidylethanolamine-binding protein (PEBP) family uncharacterized protein